MPNLTIEGRVEARLRLDSRMLLRSRDDRLPHSLPYAVAASRQLERTATEHRRRRQGRRAQLRRPAARASYAVANSNTGHDSGAEPRASFAHDDLDATIDFGHRAVHLTAIASKTLVQSLYGRPATHTYFEGCSTGGRQGLMEAQRYPDDFDGIVAGAPVFDYQRLNITHVWMAQRVFADNLAATSPSTRTAACPKASPNGNPARRGPGEVRHQRRHPRPRHRRSARAATSIPP